MAWSHTGENGSLGQSLCCWVRLVWDVSAEEEVVKSTVKSKVLVGYDHLVIIDMAVSANYHEHMTYHMIV